MYRTLIPGPVITNDNLSKYFNDSLSMHVITEYLPSMEYNTFMEFLKKAFAEPIYYKYHYNISMTEGTEEDEYSSYCQSLIYIGTVEFIPYMIKYCKESTINLLPDLDMGEKIVKTVEMYNRSMAEDSPLNASIDVINTPSFKTIGNNNANGTDMHTTLDDAIKYFDKFVYIGNNLINIAKTCYKNVVYEYNNFMY